MKKIIIIIIILLVGFIGGIFLFFLDREGFDITVDNQTNTEISGLYLTYANKNIEIPSIPSGKEYEFNVNPTEEFGESSMILNYKDKKGKLHTEYVFGYIEKGYSGEAIITLKTIDKNGNVQIDIEENTSLY